MVCVWNRNKWGRGYFQESGTQFLVQLKLFLVIEFLYYIQIIDIFLSLFKMAVPIFILFLLLKLMHSVNLVDQRVLYYAKVTKPLGIRSSSNFSCFRCSFVWDLVSSHWWQRRNFQVLWTLFFLRFPLKSRMRGSCRGVFNSQCQHQTRIKEAWR